MKYARRRDANEREIIQALEAYGAAVEQLDGAGTPDLLVSWRGELSLLEVKDHDPNERTKPVRRNDATGAMAALTPSQVKWWARWKGKSPVIVQNAEEALRAIGAKQ